MAFKPESVEARIESEWVGATVTVVDEPHIIVETNHFNGQMLDQVEDMGWAFAGADPVDESTFELTLYKY